MKHSARSVLDILSKRYPSTGLMDLGNPSDTLLATILSARTRDTQVLKIYPAFRKRFPDWETLAAASPSTIAASISSIGMYRNKAKAIHALAGRVLSDFGGQVPKTMDELVSLPGVGRKTASCVLAYAFHIPAVAVDTHVFRIAHRLGWSAAKDPEEVEENIKKLLPRTKWIAVNRTFVQFGRDVCQPRMPQCWRCPVAHLCPFKPKTPTP